jgi:hypothetical protein
MANDDKEGIYASRRDANGTIDSINLNFTKAQWLILDTECKGGTAKLVIAFKRRLLRRGNNDRMISGIARHRI